MGIGFAIPSNMASRITDQLIKHGTVTRGFLGVTLQPIDSDLASFYKLPKVQGALVTDVVKGSPADVAGLKQEDIIISYNNTPVDSLTSFRNTVSLMPPGSKLALRVNRDGKMVDLTVTIAPLPEESGGPNSPAQKLGMQIQPLTPEIAEQFGYQNEKGVIITKVAANSPAATAGLRPGTLILAINRKKISTIEECNLALQEAVKEGRLLLMVRQGETFRFIAIPLDEK